MNCGLILYTVDTVLITFRISREANTTSILLFIQRGTPRYLITWVTVSFKFQYMLV